MTEFDCNDNKIVGYVDFVLNTSNAKIEVVGYTDWRNEFHKLTDKEIIDLFPPKGKIFAYNFAERHYETKGTLVCISVMETKKGGDGYDAYVWNMSGGVYEYGSVVRKLKTEFTANGQYNYNILKENELLDIERDTFVSSGGLVYLIKSDGKERLVPYWNESSLETLTVHGRLFVTGHPKSGEDGKIDITTDEQLLEWYLKNILKKNWGEIFKQKTFRNVEPLLRDAFSVSKGLDGLIVGSRIKRLTHINRAVILTFEELNELKTLPWLSHSIEQSILTHKDAFLKDVEEEKAKELQEIRERYDMEILIEKENVEKAKLDLERQTKEINEIFMSKQAEYEKLLNNKKFEADLIDETLQSKNRDISTLEESISHLEKRKEEIIDDFTVVREVLGVNNIARLTGISASFFMEELWIAENAIPVYQAYVKSIENTLKANQISHTHATKIGQLLIAFNTILVPDASIAKVIIAASMRCRYLVEYVSATWKSFTDLWENGLGYVVEECRKNKDLMHFLLLQNINLTYLPNYMMPLIDIQRGVITKFPDTGDSFPNNLRILCTITKDEVMPLSGDCLRYIGCVDKSISKENFDIIVSPADTVIGYLIPQVLADVHELAKDVPNYYKDYLEDD